MRISALSGLFATSNAAENLGTPISGKPELTPAPQSAGVLSLLDKPDQETRLRTQFQAEFKQVAQNPGRFHAVLRESLGSGYDQQAAERIRRQVLAGDSSWLPNIHFVSNSTLNGNNGAYDAESRTVLLNADRRWDVGLMARTVTEEVGHHLDTLLNQSDASGDEGEMFGRILGGQKLDAAEAERIRAEEDHGSIQRGGKGVAVEFSNSEAHTFLAGFFRLFQRTRTNPGLFELLRKAAGE